MSFCQPNVMGLLIFHAFDETALDRFQSGLYYPDETPKSSLPAVRASARDVRGGVIAKCDGLELTPKAKVAYPRVRSISAGTAAIGVTCDIDCSIYARLERLPRALDHAGRPRAQAKPASAPSPSSARRASLPGATASPFGSTAPVNRGQPLALASAPLMSPLDLFTSSDPAARVPGRSFKRPRPIFRCVFFPCSLPCSSLRSSRQRPSSRHLPRRPGRGRCSSAQPRMPPRVEARDAKMALAGQAGFDTIRITSIWRPGETAVAGDELATLQTVADAATANGIRLIVSVYPYGSATTPRYATARAQFAAYAASIPRLVPSIRYVIVGNEPNLNRFWMPQFTKKGLDAAASSYLGLLAQTYDAIKAVAPGTIVIGGSLAPRGSDNPRSSRPTHSPTRFILDLGKAYRLSGRRSAR